MDGKSPHAPTTCQPCERFHGNQSGISGVGLRGRAWVAADYPGAGALRSDIAHQDRVIKNQIDTQQALLKKNQQLAKDAAKLDEKNKKLAEKNKKLEAKNKAFNDEKARNEAQNADLARKHDAIKAAEKPIATQ